MRRPLLPLLLLALTACGGAAAPLDVAAPSTSTTPTTAPVVAPPEGGAPVLQLADRCYGACFFLSPLGLPAVVLYADGTVVAARRDLPDPRPLLQQGEVDAARVRSLLALAREAGLDVGGSSRLTYPDGPAFADGGAEVLTARVDGRTTTVESPQPSDPSLDGRSSDPAQRRLLRELAEELRTLPADAPLAADRVVLRAGPAAPSVPAQAAWPGPPLADLPAQGDARCAVLDGAPAGQVRAAVADDAFPTVYTDGGRRWSVQARAVLPHERGCAEVAETVRTAEAGGSRTG